MPLKCNWGNCGKQKNSNNEGRTSTYNQLWYCNDHHRLVGQKYKEETKDSVSDKNKSKKTCPRSTDFNRKFYVKHFNK